MSKDLFHYSSFLKPICEHLTHHKYNKLILWQKSFGDFGYQNSEKHDFYYKCIICGYVFLNNHPSKEDIKYIKMKDKMEGDKR